jgi:hypothetical protein
MTRRKGLDRVMGAIHDAVGLGYAQTCKQQCLLQLV